MKRAIFISVALSVVLSTLTGCSPQRPREQRTDMAPATGWTRPPVLLAVRRAQASLIFSGVAEPGRRVVLRQDGGAAYAAAADERGRFEIRMAAPTGTLLLRPETQVGQNVASSPDRLLILDGGRGPIAVLRAGGPTRRLDLAPALGAIDSDGEGLLASGRTPGPSGGVEIVAGGETVQVTSDRTGRWSVVLGPTAPSDTIRVAGRAFVWPGLGAPGDPLHVERAGEGWRVGWSGPAGARQWTWLPDTLRT